MPREAFHHELEELFGEVLELGRQVEVSLGTMVNALESYDAQVAEKQLGSDVLLKERGADIDEECMILQARQAPVARDLRLIYTIQAVTNHLVRAGTLCEHICHAIVDTAGCDRDEDVEVALLEMARASRELFGLGLAIFEERDIDRARDLEAADDKVDLLYSEAMNLVVNPSDGMGTPEWRVRTALTVHYLERIADHGVDIGVRVVFLVTGERIESVMRQYRGRNLDNDQG
jgi:phosphate transport system protein